MTVEIIELYNDETGLINEAVVEFNFWPGYEAVLHGDYAEPGCPDEYDICSVFVQGEEIEITKDIEEEIIHQLEEIRGEA